MRSNAVSPRSRSFAAFTLLIFLLACVATAASQTVTVLYNFGDQLSHDGNLPNGTLTLDSHGTLYGTTAQGGLGNEGMVFALVPPAVAGGAWIESAIFNNFSGPNGSFVNGGLVLNQQSGKLYGTTHDGGSRDAGVIFELSPPKQSGALWTETVLYNFSGTEGGTDGGFPASGLIADSRGALYGTTQGGGQHQNGTVFRLSPPSHPGGAWSEKILHSFEGRGDGAMPINSLVIDDVGVLYGVTPFAGANRSGAVFKVSPPDSGTGAWTESVIYSFTGAHDGSLPDGRFPATSLIVDHAGNLYGTTNRGGNTCISGCGTIFRLSPPTVEGGAWTESILYSFASHFDGGSPSDAFSTGLPGIVVRHNENWGHPQWRHNFQADASDRRLSALDEDFLQWICLGHRRLHWGPAACGKQVLRHYNRRRNLADGHYL